MLTIKAARKMETNRSNQSCVQFAKPTKILHSLSLLYNAEVIEDQWNSPIKGHTTSTIPVLANAGI